MTAIRRRTGAAATVTALALLAAGATGAQAAPADDDGPTLLYVESDDLRAADAVAVAGLDVIGSQGDQAVVLGDQTTAAALADAGVPVVRSQSYADSLSAPARAGRASAAATAGYPVPERLAGTAYETFFGGYRTLAAYEQFLGDVSREYGDLTELVDYGDSWRKTQDPATGHDLLALRITAGAADDGAWESHDNGKPRFVLTAQAHAREIVTSELAWRFVVELLDGYGSDPQITALLDSTEIWVSPHNNPDGVDIVEGAFAAGVTTNAAGDATPANSSKAWQRKNANGTAWTGGSTNYSSNQPGVDLNRNWAEAWGGAQSSASPGSASYRGTAAFSEPESQAQSELLTTLFGSYRVGTDTAAPDDRQGTLVTLHSYSDYVIYPYAYSRTANVPNLDALKTLGFRQSLTNGFNTGKAGEILYDNAGNDIDWIYANLGVPAYTWEIGTASTGGFFPAYSRVETFWAAQNPGLLYAARAAADPYVSPSGPSVTDATVTWQADGSVAVQGVADDDAFGRNASAAARRPAAQQITAVEAVIGPDPSAGPVRSVPLTGSGTSAAFAGVVPPSGDAHARQLVHVRAQDASGAWGPWTARWLEPLAAGPGAGHELIVADVQPGVLTLEVPAAATVALSAVTLTGRDQLADGALEAIRVLDGRGTQAGWVLSGQVSDFGGTGGGVILADNLGWTPEARTVAGELGLQVADGATGQVEAGSAVRPGQAEGLSVPQSLAASPAGTSAGEFEAGGALQLGIPASASAGVYTGVLTLTLV